VHLAAHEEALIVPGSPRKGRQEHRASPKRALDPLDQSRYEEHGGVLPVAPGATYAALPIVVARGTWCRRGCAHQQRQCSSSALVDGSSPSLSLLVFSASLFVLSEALDPHSARADLPKRPPCTANRQCALACHATARALAHIATVAASGPRQRASPRSVRSAGASPASRGSTCTRLLMLAPARACRTVSMGAVTPMTEGARLSLPPPNSSHAVSGWEAVPTRAQGIDRCSRWPKIALPSVPWIRLAKSEGTG